MNKMVEDSWYMVHSRIFHIFIFNMVIMTNDDAWSRALLWVPTQSNGQIGHHSPAAVMRLLVTSLQLHYNVPSIVLLSDYYMQHFFFCFALFLSNSIQKCSGPWTTYIISVKFL